MARATTVRKKASSTNGGNHSQASVTVISGRNNNSLEDEIRLRAYLLYEQEGRQEGRDHEYWVRAESEVLESHGQRRR
jgi:hypothetical protein